MLYYVYNTGCYKVPQSNKYLIVYIITNGLKSTV